MYSSDDDHHTLENDSQMVPVNDTENLLSDHAPITASEENQVMDVSIPLDPCFNCHVELTRCEVEYEVISS